MLSNAPAVASGQPQSLQAWFTFSSGQIEALKWLGVFFMTLDHIYKILLPDQPSALWLEWLGRAAFPLFSFVLAYNLTFHSQRPGRTLMWLAVWAAISQPVYIWAFDNGKLNILFTLLLGALWIVLLKHGQPNRGTYGQGLALAGITWLLGWWADYHHWGIFLPVVYYGLLSQGGAVWTVLAGVSTMAINAFAYIGIGLGLAVTTLQAVHKKQLSFARTPRWAFYIYYPLHLACLAGASIFLAS